MGMNWFRNQQEDAKKNIELSAGSTDFGYFQWGFWFF